jgi:predicted nucleic acid-binding protein
VKGLFVDTAGWAAFLVRSEAFHDQAVFLLEHARENGRSVLTTSYVMAELVALLSELCRHEGTLDHGRPYIRSPF